LSHPWGRLALIVGIVLLMFVAALIEISLWAALYLAVGAIPALEPALYFLTVTFTTLGYGDVVLQESWCLMAAFQAANGTIMFGWTTALIFAFVHRMSMLDEGDVAG
jgi:hypothetical protein